MNRLTDIFSKELPSGVTEEDLAKARQELKSRQAADPRFYVSSDPILFEKQARVLAMGEAHKRRQIAVVQDEYAGLNPDEIERIRQVKHDEAVSYKLFGIESKLAGYSLYASNIKPTLAVKYFRDRLYSPGQKNFLLLGNPGCGKSVAAGAFISSLADIKTQAVTGTQFVNAKYIKAYKLHLLVDRRKDDDLALIERTPFLFVDDLGEEPDPGAGYKGKDFIQYFSDLFSERHDKGRITVMTSNFTTDQFKDLYGERVISRFRETGKPYDVSGPDLRVDR